MLHYVRVLIGAVLLLGMMNLEILRTSVRAPSSRRLFAGGGGFCGFAFCTNS